MPVPAGGAPEDPILDPRSPGVEVAMRLIELDFGVDWDQTLDEPDYAQEFDRLASEYAPPASPSTHRQLAQRMARAVPVNEASAELAKQSAWGTDPDTIPAVSGVFLVVGDQGPLLAGATRDLRTTVGDLQSSEAWNQLQPKELRWHVAPQASPQELAAWRAFLVRDQKPMLNRRREPESTAG